MRRAGLLLLASLGVVVTGAPRMTAGAPRAETSPNRRLIDAEPSIDSLIQKFCRALTTKDKTLLRRLRVTEDEYRNLILPGSVEVDQAPGQPYSEQASRYFWGVLNGKSIYSEAGLLADFGGHDLRVKSIAYRHGIKKYRDYTAYQQITLELDEEDGHSGRMRIGSIAEVDGQYKFISYVRN